MGRLTPCLNWPDYTPRGARSGKSLPAPDHCAGRNTSRPQGYRPHPGAGPRPALGAAPASTVTPVCASRCSPGSNTAGRRSRSLVGRRDAGRTIIAHETIYRFIYAQTTRTKPARAWRHYLPRAKWRRGWRGRRCRLPHGAPWRSGPPPPARSGIGKPIDALPHQVLTVHEPTPGCSPSDAAALARLLGPLPAPWRQTVTFDHRVPTSSIPSGSSCDTHAPWQKGGVENAIGRLRRGCPASPTSRRSAGAVYGVAQYVQ